MGRDGSHPAASFFDPEPSLRDARAAGDQCNRIGQLVLNNQQVAQEIATEFLGNR
jgi:hypothetical protein